MDSNSVNVRAVDRWDQKIQRIVNSYLKVEEVDCFRKRIDDGWYYAWVVRGGLRLFSSLVFLGHSIHMLGVGSGLGRIGSRGS